MDRPGNELIAQLLGLLAHDLRNPLSALHSNLGFLQTSLQAADLDTREALDDTLVSCDGLAHIIDNLEILSHDLSGSPRPDRAEVPIGRLVQSVAKRAQDAARSHEVALELDPSVDTRARVRVDPEMFERAFGNLLRNAIQHAGSPVRVSVREADGRCVVRIEDGGEPLGESADDAFTAEGQLVAKTSHDGRYSRGLGLYCARVAAEAAGAELHAAECDRGNAFELCCDTA